MVKEDKVPRVDAIGQVNPAEDASRLFSMSATMNICECLRNRTAKVTRTQEIQRMGNS